MFRRRDWLMVLGVFGLDQVTKWVAQASLVFFRPVDVISGMLSFELVHNYGAAYGIFQGQRVFLLSVGFLVIGGIVFFHKHFVQSNYSRFALIFLLGGALGNVCDRLFLGYVVDFIDIRIFPVFNLADVSIDIAVGLFVIEMIVMWRREKKLNGR